MSKLPLISTKEFEKLLFQLGFQKVRQKESHAIYGHTDGRYTVLAHHKGRVIFRPLLRQILKQIGLTIQEYQNML